MLATACTEYQEVVDVDPLTLSTEEISVSGTQDTESEFIFNTRGHLEIKPDCNWLSMDKLSYDGNHTVYARLFAKTNPTITEREGHLIFTVTDPAFNVSLTKTLTIKQGRGASQLEVYGSPYNSSNTVKVTSDGRYGTESQFYVKSNVDFTLSTQTNWIHLSTTSGKGNPDEPSIIKFNFDPNTEKGDRLGEILVSSCDNTISAPLYVEQAAHARTLNISPTEMTISPYSSADNAITITTNLSLEVTCNNDWITIQNSKFTVEDLFGISEFKLLFSAEPNTTDAERSATIKIKSNEGYEGVVTIKQPVAPTIAFDSSEQYSVNYTQGVHTVGISTTTEWVATSNNSEWLTLQNSEGTSENTTLSFTVTENNTELIREATITLALKAEPTINATMKVIQDHANTLYYYVAQNYSKISSFNNTSFDATIQEHTFNEELGKGRVVFDGKLTKIGTYNIPYNDWDYITGIELPSTLTTIEEYAFYSCDYLTSIDLPASVKSIGNSAFYACGNIESIAMSEGLESIGYSAFSLCSKLKTLNIPTTVISIGSAAFQECTSLETIAIPNSLSAIESSTFRNCSSLTNINIPYTVSQIGHYAFDGCSSLTQISIPEGVMAINTGTFSNCSSLASIILPKTITTFNTDAFAGCTALAKVQIGNFDNWCNTTFDGVTSNPLYAGRAALYENDLLVSRISGAKKLPHYGFAGCSSITEVYTGSLDIGDYAFYECKKLTYASLGTGEVGSYSFAYSGLTSIGFGAGQIIRDHAFYQCDLLDDITIFCATYIGKYAFYGSGVDNVQIGSTYSSSSSITIDEYAFKMCNSLDSVSFYNVAGGIDIGKQAFYDCMYLKSINFPSCSVKIGEEAFARCDWKLTDVVIDAKAEIGKSAFDRCDKLKTLTLGKEVVSIGNSAFSNCDDLTTVTSKATTPPTAGTNIFTTTALTDIFVPTSSVSKYKSKTNWSTYESYIKDGGFE